MRNWLVILLSLGVMKVYATINLDSLVESVYASYLAHPYSEYQVEIKRYDSSGKKLYSQTNMMARFRRPDYHFVINQEVEKIYYKSNYYELHHKDSTIYVLLNAPVDSSYLNTQELVTKLKNYKFIYELEYETKTQLKIRMKNPEDIAGFYMSFIIDKKAMQITQNQMNKVELEDGKSKIFLYQMDYKKYIQNDIGEIKMDEITAIVSSPKKKENSKYRHYKIEYKN